MPDQPKNPVGRPEFKPTKKQRRRVELLAGEVTEDAIARQIGVSTPTLRKHLAAELEDGRARVLADNLERLDTMAAKGNASAAKALVSRKDLLPQRSSTSPATEEAKPVSLGKKEAADMAAMEAEKGTGWDTLVRH